MPRTFTFIIMILVLLAAGCTPPRIAHQVPRGDTGQLFLYLQALPPEAGRLSFTLAGVAALREDGVAIPLTIHRQNPTGAGSDRQRLLASGRLAPGTYRGIALTVDKARVATEDGEMALLTSEDPVIAAVPFTVNRQGAILLEVAYRHAGSIGQQFRFIPAFFAHQPVSPVLTRVAFGSIPTADHVLVFDRKSLQATSVLAVGKGPTGLALDEAGRRLYIALSKEDAIAVVDIFTGTVLGRIPLQFGDRPERLALTPDRSLLLTANSGSDSVSLIDPQAMVELTRVDVGDEPQALNVDPAGRRAFVFNLRSDSISIIDLDRRRLLTTLTTDSGPARGAFNRDGSRLYVVYRSSPYLNVLDPATLALVDHQQVGIGVSAILVDVRTDLVYLSSAESTHIDIYDPFSLQPVDYLQTPEGGNDLLIDDEENRLLLASADGSVTAVNLVSRREAGELETAGAVHTLAMAGARR